MQPLRIETLVHQLHRELSSALAGATGMNVRRLVLEVGVEAIAEATGEIRLQPVLGNAAPEAVRQAPHRLTVEWVPPDPMKRPPASSAGAVPERAPLPAGEPAAAGDPATIRRRLEFVLGGPPGFTTGARAEILSDLLREVDRRALIEAIERDWVTQFDTGIAASPSVTKPEKPQDP